MFIIKYRKIFYAISGLLIALSLAALSIWGLKLGVDFKGGSILEVEYQNERPSGEMLRDALVPLDVSENIRTSGEKDMIIRMRTLASEEEHQNVLKALSLNGTYPLSEKLFNSIGPLLGKEARNKAILSVIFVLIAIVLFIAFAFRHVSKPVSSWKYGLIAIIALFHDIIVPVGVFAIFGHFLGYEVDTLFVTALLVILGFSIHDTIVVFDRVRENLKNEETQRQRKPFEEIVGDSVGQTFVRSVNTSLTTLLALIVLYFVGAEATKHFSLALIIGIAVGTYSSIFLGSPLLVTFQKWQERKVAKAK